MDPTSNSPRDRDGARQLPTWAQGAARTGRIVAVYLARRLWQAAIYLGATALDSIDAVRLALLTRSRAKYPDRAGDFDAQMARLREQGSKRWSSWNTLPAGRRMEIRFAAAALAVAAILGLRAYLTHGGSPAEQVAHQPTPAHAPAAAPPRGVASTPPVAPAVDQALLAAEHFMENRKHAAPGRWVVYGVDPVESARPNLAEAEARTKAAQAAASAARDKAEESRDKVSGERSRYESLFKQHASQEAFREADRIIKADQAEADADRVAAAEAGEAQSASVSALSAARAALDRAQYPVVRPVLTRSEVHHWDDFKVMSPVVIKDGSRSRMWYAGCHFIGEEYTCGIGHAQSRDGIAWEKSPGPVLAIEDPAVSQDLHSIAVVRTGDGYLMWYSIDQNPLHGNDCATLNLATSRDGLAWKPEGLVLSANCQSAAHLWQSAFSDGKTIHLWYADYDSSANGSLVHLVSSDGRSWQQAGSTDIGALGKDPRRLWVMPDHSAGFRALIAMHDRSGRFGMLQSSDGNSWSMAGDAWKLVEPVERGEYPLFSSGDDGEPEAPVAIVEPGEMWMWFAVPNTRDGSESIALAFRKEAQP